MLILAHRVAIRVYPFRHTIVLCCLLDIGGFIYLLINGGASSDKWLLLLSVVFGWLICLLGVASNFRTVPDHPQSGDRFLSRFMQRLRRAIATFWASCFVICSILLLYLSLRSLGILLGQ